MKLSKEEKIRVAAFKFMNPQVSHRDIAYLLGVSRTTITGTLKYHGTRLNYSIEEAEELVTKLGQNRRAWERFEEKMGR